MFFKKMVEYFAKHPFFLGLLIFCVVALVAVIIAMVVIGKKRKSKSKAEKCNVEVPVKITEEDKKEEARKQEEDKKEEARKQEEAKRASHEAVWARLDAEREAAEREEQAEREKQAEKPKKKAPAKKAEVKKEEPASAPVEEKVVAEEPVKEEKPKKKTPAKKAEVKKEEPAPVPVEDEMVVAEEPVQEEKPKKKTPAKKAEVKKEEPAPAPVEEEDETAVIARYAGKWVIYHVLTDANNPEDEMYFFELHASNGEKLFASEEYTSYNGAVKGIDTYKNNIAKDNFKISTTKKGDYIFKIMSGKNTLLCNGENYATKVRCESAMKSTKRFARTAIIDENVRDLVIPVPTETDTEVTPLPEGLTGKWLISSRDVEDEKVYFFELFANNGEKLLSSEEYTTYIGAVNGIQTHKQNIAKGNFRISLTKNGDYIYKLLNGNNQLLCLGEHYKTKARCESAVESVKRFAESSPTLTDSDHIEE